MSDYDYDPCEWSTKYCLNSCILYIILSGRGSKRWGLYICFDCLTSCTAIIVVL